MRTRLASLAAVVAALLAVPSIALADTCLPAQGSIDATGVRGVHVGVRANIRDPDGKPLNVKKVSYCVEDGGAFGFALTREQDVVLVLSSSEGDAIGPINPTSPDLSARAEFPFAADPNRCASSGNPPGCIPLPNEMNACNGDMWKDASTNVCTQDAAVNASPNELFGVSGMG